MRLAIVFFECREEESEGLALSLNDPGSLWGFRCNRTNHTYRKFSVIIYIRRSGWDIGNGNRYVIVPNSGQQEVITLGICTRHFKNMCISRSIPHHGILKL